MRSPPSPAPGHFTGERLHADSPLFAADLARHEAVYRYARSILVPALRSGRVLDLGCGSGYGTRGLASASRFVAGLDRVFPDSETESTASRSRPIFVLGDLLATPFRTASFSALVSLQVIEHLARPDAYLTAAAALLECEGQGVFSTPNRLTSEGANPHHVREYSGAELSLLLARHFRHVDLLAVHTSERARRYQDARRRLVARLLRLDLLRLRDRLPRPVVERAFGILAVVVRLLVRRRLDSRSITWEDYPVGPYRDDSLDLVAVCRR